MSINIRKLKQLDVKPGSWHDRIRSLYLDGYFKTPKLSSDIVSSLHGKFGETLETVAVQTYMKKFMPDYISCFKLNGGRKLYWHQADLLKSVARSMVDSKSNGNAVNHQLFSPDLIVRLGNSFEREIEDMALVFGRSGTCTAFLLRKILEKLIFIAFSKINKSDSLKDDAGDFVGLSKFLELASQEKILGKPILMPGTKKRIDGIKFLGDTSAHNPLINVDMEDIIPQIPFIVTAYKEILSHP